MPGATPGGPGGAADTPLGLAPLASQWLEEKLIASRASNPTEASRTRRNALCRAARALAVAGGRTPPEGPYDLAADLGWIAAADLERDVVVRALGVLRTTHAEASVAQSASTLRSFTRWLTRRGVLATDPCDDLPLPPASKSAGTPAGKYFTQPELERLEVALANPQPGATGAWPARDVAVLAVLTGCGPRASELAGLRVADVDRSLDRAVLRVTQNTKGSKLRQVPLPRRVTELVDAYLAERVLRAAANPAYAPAESSPLFVRKFTRGGVDVVTAIDRNWLYRLVERACRDAGVGMRPDAGVHATRHSFGVELARRRVPEFLLQQLMGHADPATTSVYTRFTASDAIDALDDAGWL